MYRYMHKFMYKCANVFVYALCLCAYVYVMICIIHVWAITLYHGVCLYMCVFTNACPYACLCVCFMMCMYSLYFCACVCYSLDTFVFVCFVCIYSYMCVCMHIHACRPLCLHICTMICIYPVCMCVFAQVHGRFIYFHSWIMWLQRWQVSWDGNPGRAEVTAWSQKVEIPPPREASAISLGAFNWWSEATHSTGGTCFTQRLLSQVLIMFLKITTAVSNQSSPMCGYHLHPWQTHPADGKRSALLPKAWDLYIHLLGNSAEWKGVWCFKNKQTKDNVVAGMPLTGTAFTYACNVQKSRSK